MLNASNMNAYIGLGSNVGDRAGNLLLAIRGMMEAGMNVTQISNIYETEPVETFKQGTFLNMVAELRGNTLPPPEELMRHLLRIENSLGRTREVLLAPRSIDLDLLLYRNEISNTPFLTLPHARLYRRRFVLVPLAELAPHLIHPTLNKAISELLEALDDDFEVRPWNASQK
jgi:2-amino-4-hydroxy-6-hydroxymethyldihydropteridine diphosphokinase